MVLNQPEKISILKKEKENMGKK
ncbi:hypothetical protein CIY_01210 [Butyrivibrio fibrisolvens 16/4]|nr:hypothetical protein CIY_01210 [Butyrivibrio fibrisolvens 16/4]